MREKKNAKMNIINVLVYKIYDTYQMPFTVFFNYKTHAFIYACHYEFLSWFMWATINKKGAVVASASLASSSNGKPAREALKSDLCIFPLYAHQV